MDPTSLAHTVGSALTPFLPYLLMATDKAMEEGAKAFGAEAWEWAVQLWTKLRRGVEAEPAALSAARDLSKSPTEAAALARFERHLQAVLIADRQIAADINGLLERSPSHVQIDPTIKAVGERSVAIGGNVNQGTIQTGDFNVSKQSLD